MKLPFGYEIVKEAVEPQALHVTVHVDKKEIARAVLREMHWRNSVR